MQENSNALSHKEREIEFLRKHKAFKIPYVFFKEGMLVRPHKMIEYFNSLEDYVNYFDKNTSWAGIKKGYSILVPLLVLEKTESHCKLLLKEKTVYVVKYIMEDATFAILV